MGIGTGIFLIVVGAILTFALNVETSVINLDLVGYILMAAGAVVFIISLVLAMRQRSSVSTTRQVDNGGAERVTQRETRSDNADPLV